MTKALEHSHKYVGFDYEIRIRSQVFLRMSDVFPVTTDDERDPREDQKDDRKREEEIRGDKPPHHDE
jgi:hypothetical protein